MGNENSSEQCQQEQVRSREAFESHLCIIIKKTMLRLSLYCSIFWLGSLELEHRLYSHFLFKVPLTEDGWSDVLILPRFIPTLA
jgi:hypothetical protein